MSDVSEKKERPRDPVYILVIVMLMIGLGIMLAQYMNVQDKLETCNGNVEKLNADLESAVSMMGSDAETFKEDLQNMLQEYDELIDNNASLGSQNKELMDSLNANREKVEKLLKSAQQNKYLQRELYKYKKEAETLRNIMKGYVHTIDSLMIENSNLRFDLGETKKELTDANKTIDTYKEKTTKLEKTVEAGKNLKVMNLAATALRISSGGSQKETNRAKRSDMFKACFMILENPMADAGPKNIYLRALTPGGTVLDEGTIRTFKVDSDEIQYSSSREVDYQNADVDMCVYLDLQTEVDKGTYVIEIYADGVRIGKTTLDLK